MSLRLNDAFLHDMSELVKHINTISENMTKEYQAVNDAMDTVLNKFKDVKESKKPDRFDLITDDLADDYGTAISYAFWQLKETAQEAWSDFLIQRDKDSQLAASAFERMRISFEKAVQDCESNYRVGKLDVMQTFQKLIEQGGKGLPSKMMRKAEEENSDKRSPVLERLYKRDGEEPE